jgi:hypothetical protein
MTRTKRWRDLGPSLLLASGIVAGQSAQSSWSDLAGASLLGLCLLVADALSARMRGMPTKPSLPAWIMAYTCGLVGILAMLREPGHTGSLIPVLGLGAWAVLFMRDGKPRATCTFD